MARESAFRRPRTMRSQLMLEVASELSLGHVPGLQDEWPYHQVMIHLRGQGDEKWRLCFFASDGPESIDAIMSGDASFAICNPGAVLAMAVRGTGPYPEPLPLRAIMVLPQFDQLGFGVAPSATWTSLTDIAEQRPPIRISLRGQRDHSLHVIVNEVLRVHGFSLDDVESWEGEVRYDDEMPNGPSRLGGLQNGTVDLVIDEAMPMWAAKTIDFGGRFLEIDEPHLQALEQIGLRRVAITREEWPKLARDVWTVDFSGWPVFCREDLDDEIVRAFCIGLENRKDRIPWYGEGPMRLDIMCKDTKEGPLDIPLHQAAEAFWRDQGYLH
ncbi:MAG: hypothetical protein HW416_1340 [Chloroflexi bacterium]|nr:hypothetical protein [Chloroflexota bacterium]